MEVSEPFAKEAINSAINYVSYQGMSSAAAGLLLLLISVVLAHQLWKHFVSEDWDRAPILIVPGAGAIIATSMMGVGIPKFLEPLGYLVTEALK